jgi:hypothetical protein
MGAQAWVRETSRSNPQTRAEERPCQGLPEGSALSRTAHCTHHLGSRRGYPARPRCLRHHNHGRYEQRGVGAKHGRFAASGHQATLTGAGSTFDMPFFDLASAKYHQQHPAVCISYAAVGSGAGIAAFPAKKPTSALPKCP